MSVKKKVDATILAERNKKTIEESRKAYTSLLQIALKVDDVESRLQLERQLRNLDEEEREIDRLLEASYDEEEEGVDKENDISPVLTQFYATYPQLSPASPTYSPVIANSFKAHLSEKLFGAQKQGVSVPAESMEFYSSVLEETLNTLAPKKEEEKEEDKVSKKESKNIPYEGEGGESFVVSDKSYRSDVLTPSEQQIMLRTAPYDIRNDPKLFQDHVKQTLALKGTYKNAPVVSEEFNNKKILIESERLMPFVIGGN